jgi:hypothetical protein
VVLYHVTHKTCRFTRQRSSFKHNARIVTHTEKHIQSTDHVQLRLCFAFRQCNLTSQCASDGALCLFYGALSVPLMHFVSIYGALSVPLMVLCVYFRTVPVSTVFTKLSRPSFNDINAIRCTRISITDNDQPTYHLYRAKKRQIFKNVKRKSCTVLYLATNNADRCWNLTELLVKYLNYKFWWLISEIIKCSYKNSDFCWIRHSKFIYFSGHRVPGTSPCPLGRGGGIPTGFEPHLDSTALHARKTEEWWAKKDLEESGRGLTEVIPRHLVGGTEENSIILRLACVTAPPEYTLPLSLCQHARFLGWWTARTRQICYRLLLTPVPPIKWAHAVHSYH